MNKKEFFEEFKKMCEYYNNKLYEKKEIVQMYYDTVKNITLLEFKETIKTLVEKHKFMPKICEFKSRSNFTQRDYDKEFLESFYDT